MEYVSAKPTVNSRDLSCSQYQWWVTRVDMKRSSWSELKQWKEPLSQVNDKLDKDLPNGVDSVALFLDNHGCMFIFKTKKCMLIGNAKNVMKTMEGKMQLQGLEGLEINLHVLMSTTTTACNIRRLMKKLPTDV